MIYFNKTPIGGMTLYFLDIITPNQQWNSYRRPWYFLPCTQKHRNARNDSAIEPCIATQPNDRSELYKKTSSDAYNFSRSYRTGDRSNRPQTLGRPESYDVTCTGFRSFATTARGHDRSVNRYRIEEKIHDQQNPR